MAMAPRKQVPRKARPSKRTTPTVKAPASAMPVKAFASKEVWQAWLESHHASTSGVWVQLARTNADVKSVTREEALDVALCYGWIDGQAKSHDIPAERQVQRPGRA